MGVSYATTADLTSLGLPAKALAGIGTPAQEAALEAASRVVDSYVGSRYDLPLVSVGSDIKDAVCTIAAVNLMSVRGFAAGVEDAEVLMTRKKDAMTWLRDVAKGLATPSVIDTTDQTKPPTNPQRAPFTAAITTPRGW